MRRTKEDALKTYRTILDTSLNLFNKNGYNGTTISDIADAANVTRGAVYWHFKNKSDIFIAIGDLHLTDIKRQLRFAIDSCSPLKNLASIIANYFELLEHDSEKYKFFALMHRYSNGFPSDHRFNDKDAFIQEHFYNLWYEVANNLICSAIAKGELPPHTDEKFANIYIRSGLLGLSHCYFNTLEQVDVSKYSHHVMNDIIHNLRYQAAMREAQ